MTKFGVTVSAIILVVLLGLGYFFFISPNSSPQNVPDSSGTPTENPTGVTNLEPATHVPVSPSTPTVSGGCFVGGCSSEICSDQQGAVSNCIYKDEFACYKTATCERQASGKCGWTQTSELNSCIKNGGPGDRVAAGYVVGHVTIGPNCPVEQADKPCPTPTEAYTSREALAYMSDGKTIDERIHLNADGSYKLTLGPGSYFIQISPAGIGEGEKKPVTVKSFETSVVDFDIDTGIR